jgi:hypothetical protein
MSPVRNSKLHRNYIKITSKMRSSLQNRTTPFAHYLSTYSRYYYSRKILRRPYYFSTLFYYSRYYYRRCYYIRYYSRHYYKLMDALMKG